VGLDSQQTYEIEPKDQFEYAKLRAKSFNLIASEIMERERGQGFSAALTGGDHIFCSPVPDETPGICTVRKMTAIIFSDMEYINGRNSNAPQFGILSGADKKYLTEDGRMKYSQKMYKEGSVSKLRGTAQPGCHIYFDVMPGANINLGSLDNNQSNCSVT
jgi:hypothetical protein